MSALSSSSSSSSRAAARVFLSGNPLPRRTSLLSRRVAVPLASAAATTTLPRLHRRWESSGPSPPSPPTLGPNKVAPGELHRGPDFGFVFDIDGVLLHRSSPIAGARETIQFLQKHKIPFIFLTNGGGQPEAVRVQQLSEKLGVELDTSLLVQSHTPYQLLTSAKKIDQLKYAQLAHYLVEKVGVEDLRESTVLVLGSDASAARRIAQGYGFQSVVTPADILTACPEIFPFDPLSEFYSKQEIQPLPKPIYNPKTPGMKLEDSLKIDAILVFNDPRDWAVDIQLIMDLMLSHRGYLGTYSHKNSSDSLNGQLGRWQWQSDGQPALIFSNGDLLWSTGYHLSRFGQGAFRHAVTAQLSAIVAQTEGYPFHRMKVFSLGKPQVPAYSYAQRVLLQRFRALWPSPASDGAETPPQEAADDQLWTMPDGSPDNEAPVPPPKGPRLSHIYMVGDNPHSDISGVISWIKHTSYETNRNWYHGKPSGPKWYGCLVRTGVWDEDKMPLSRLGNNLRPTTVQDNVKDAVNFALQRQRWPERLE